MEKDLSLTKEKHKSVEFVEKLFNKSFRTNRSVIKDGKCESVPIGYCYINHKIKE